MVKIQWYPGHMEKARRQMNESLKAVDIVIELRDARIPLASANPMLDQMAANKPRLIILSKADLADPEETKNWIDALKGEDQMAISFDLQRDRDIRKRLLVAVKELYKAKREKQIARGIRPRAARALVCGIPNVGKSTFINRIAGRNTAKTADRPGVTRSLSWIHADPEVDLLDTPGVLWPKFDDEKIGTNLALVGSINDDIVDLYMLSMDGIHILSDRYPGLLQEVYGAQDNDSPPKVLDAISNKRNLKKADDKPDRQRAAILFLQELRKGKIGRVTLEGANEADQETVSE